MEISEILSTATSTQSPYHKTNKKKRHKQTTQQQAITAAIRQGKLREMTKCFLTRFS